MKPLILLTGATGYVGGRLLKRLEADQQTVRCIARRPEFLRSHVGSGTEVVSGDLLNIDSLRQAMAGVHAAYYLCISMGTGHGFEETDRRAAESFATAARAEGIQRIIYLGGFRETAFRSYLLIYEAARRSVRFCANREYRSSNFEPRLSWVQAVFRLR